MNQRILLFLAAVLTCLACRPSDPEILAIYSDGGELRLADLEAFIRALPEPQRAPPSADLTQDWLEDRLKDLAFAQGLAKSAAVRARLASPESDLQRRWAKVTRLAHAVTAQLAETVQIDEGVLQARLDSMEQAPAASQELINFRHIFLRLDRAGSPAERQKIRRLAHDLVERAAAGDDFAELAIRHSQSAGAGQGGLVENQRPARLEETARQAVAALDEGEISPVVETRTGLHIFKLERRLHPPLPDPRQHGQLARNLAAREAMATARQTLLAELRSQLEIATATFPWSVGDFVFSEEELQGLLTTLGSADTEEIRRWVIEQLIFAEAGRRQGLLTRELEAQVEEAVGAEAIALASREHYRDFVAQLPQDRLRLTYDAQPSGFASRELAHLELIFVPQGRDSFATQRQLEDHLVELRAGGAFAELARQISAGPAAEQGGDLGLLPPSEWARLHPEIYEAVVGLQEGEISDPIYCTGRLLNRDPRTLRGGFALVRVRERRPPQQRSFAAAIDDVRRTYAQQHAAELQKETRDAFLAAADFEILRLPAIAELAQ